MAGTKKSQYDYDRDEILPILKNGLEEFLSQKVDSPEKSLKYVMNIIMPAFEYSYSSQRRADLRNPCYDSFWEELETYFQLCEIPFSRDLFIESIAMFANSLDNIHSEMAYWIPSSC